MTDAAEQEITAKIDTTKLVRAWEEKAQKARGIKLVTAVGARTDLGRIRENNEDKFEFYVPEDEETLARKGLFYAVADGMGGHSSGQIASELALKTTINSYYNDDSPIVEESLKTAILKANALVFDTSRAIVERSGMGTTITALVLRGDEAFIAQVGDSRCYLLRNGELKQLTEDHSWVNEQVKRGGLSREEAETSPFRNVITRSLGTSPTVDVDIFTEQITPGDMFLLCSDGLTNELSDDEIRNILANECASVAAWKLVDRALENGGHDNITALVVAVKDIVRPKKKRRLGLPPW
ncbi:MAG: Stp1/IreP family PP2C-type Ser/Thr phosphatase [Armatimonadota bacterium]|nr:Stp1/IreP family PP2C-type Ser/Thr phosphatase [Armatimonadota bacterium]